MSNKQAIIVPKGAAPTPVDLWTDQAVSIRCTCPIADAINYKARAERLEDIKDKVIKIRDVVQHVVEMPDPDGELLPVVRTIVVTPEGKAYAAISKGVVDSLNDLKLLMGGMPPWDPPVPVQLHITRTGQGFHVYRLLPVTK